MTTLLFSLPVHEKPEIVRDQVENIRYFCPGATICIHVSASAASNKDDFRRLCDFDNVFVNPSSYETIWCEGLMHTHVSNFLYALEKGRRFDKVVLLSSNEMLVKHGLADYVAGYKLGSQTELYETANDWGSFRTDVLSSTAMRNFLARIDMRGLYFGGQAEGQFFDTGIFAHITRIFVENFPMAPCGFPSEEIIPPTVAAYYALNGVDAALPITFCDYCTNLEITTDTIDHIRRGTGTIFARRYLKALPSPHMGSATLSGVFSIKRIPREDCELRRYIRGLMV